MEPAARPAAWYQYVEFVRHPDGRPLREVLFPPGRRYGFQDGSGSHLDPREFFGGLIEGCPQGIPEDYAQALCDEVVSAQQRHYAALALYPSVSCEEKLPYYLFCYGRAECEIPLNWHRCLVQRLLDAGVHMDDMGTTTIIHHALDWMGENDQRTDERRRRLEQRRLEQRLLEQRQ